MSFLLAAGNASGATLLQLDDPTVDTDQGSAFTASFTSAPFDAGPATGWATLRRLVQDVTITGTATVKVTPVADGREYAGQAPSIALVATAGPQQPVEAPVMVPGTRFQMKVEIPAHTGQVELGESDQWFISRRTTRT